MRGTAPGRGLPPRSKRRTHSPEFKARVAMEAISGRRTIQVIAADHTIRVSQWKRQLTGGRRQRAVHEGQADQGHGRGPSQGG